MSSHHAAAAADAHVRHRGRTRSGNVIGRSSCGVVVAVRISMLRTDCSSFPFISRRRPLIAAGHPQRGRNGNTVDVDSSPTAAGRIPRGAHSPPRRAGWLAGPDTARGIHAAAPRIVGRREADRTGARSLLGGDFFSPGHSRPSPPPLSRRPNSHHPLSPVAVIAAGCCPPTLFAELGQSTAE